jgi:hypothetical protein
MKRDLPAQLAAMALVSVLPCCLWASDKKEYKAKDGSRVVILPIRKWTRDASYKSYESRVEFYSPQNQMLCALDYSSEDSEHGFGVVKAAWTPDNNYFVFSLTSSGGHQAWHAPTLFYNLGDSSIHSLDSYVDAKISKGAFSLKQPNVVLTEVWRGQQHVPTKFRLDSLTGSGHRTQNALRCTGGKTLKAEPYSLQPDA